MYILNPHDVYMHIPFLPRIAMTMSSFNISIDPLDMKYKASRMSPRCTNVSPGGTCVVLNFIDNALKQPGLAPESIDEDVL